jgi:hypothetical protein
MTRSSSSRASRGLAIAAAIAVATVVWPPTSAAAQLLSEPSSPSASEQPDLAEQYPVIELVTMGIGSMIWEKHGHIAICVRFPRPSRDRCFNYGVASFHQPVGMFMSFLRGKDSFWVAATSPERLAEQYRRADRTIFVQKLPLDQEQKRQVIKKLMFDVRPENRYYSYDHFMDNCTTRVRDILDDVTGGKLSKSGKPPAPESFRAYARAGFTGLPWALVITDLFMGRTTDAQPTHYEAMFLPDYLRMAVADEFGAEPEIVYQRQGAPHPTEGSSGRFGFFLIILLTTAPAWATRLWGRFRRLGLGIAIFFPALIGLVLWFGVVVSPVPYVRFNEAALLCMPLDFALPFLTGRRLILYARARVAIILLASLLMAIGVFHQPIWVLALWPLIPLGTVVLPDLMAQRQAAASAAALGDEEQ